jgi:hypothetical protein
MVTKGFWKRDSNQTPWSKIPRSKPKVPNLAWVSQVSQTKVPINSAIIPPSRTVLFGAGMDRMNRWAAAPMGIGAFRWRGGWPESTWSIIGLVRSCPPKESAAALDRSWGASPARWRCDTATVRGA